MNFKPFDRHGFDRAETSWKIRVVPCIGGQICSSHLVGDRGLRRSLRIDQLQDGCWMEDQRLDFIYPSYHSADLLYIVMPLIGYNVINIFQIMSLSLLPYGELSLPPIENGFAVTYCTCILLGSTAKSKCSLSLCINGPG